MGIPLIVMKHPGCHSSNKYNLLELERNSDLVDNIAKTIDRAFTDKDWLNTLGAQSKEFSFNYLVDWKQRIETELNIVRNFFYN